MNLTADASLGYCDDPLLLWERVKRKLYTIWLRNTYPFVSMGRSVSIHYPCVISRKTAKFISIGKSVVLRKDLWINVLVDEKKESKLIIEDNCSIGYRTTISTKNKIHLERNVIVAASVLIQDHNHSYDDINVPIREQGVTSGGQILIEEGCWIGHGAAIVCGKGSLVIGRNSVIGANSVITKSVPAYSVMAGNPASLVKQYDAVSKTWVKIEKCRV